MFALIAAAHAADLKYQNNFDKAEPGGVPEDMLVLDGNFAVKEEGGEKFLELPGAPLDTYGILFGPSSKENVTVVAKIFGEAKGRRYPTFDVGLGGVGGYRLRVSPGKKQIELVRNDTVKTSAPLDWKPGKWTWLSLSIASAGEGKWKIEGRIWQEGGSEPAAPVLAIEESEAPPAGRASVFGSPYSGTPIRFDDLRLTASK